ncbi:hypothetical protein [Vibrio stylophorae]|nr:hypothetical protein [Vibrio stylophorae]
MSGIDEKQAKKDRHWAWRFDKHQRVFLEREMDSYQSIEWS